jgi:predicted TIM-barrel fold metal-dependent hydrolase
MAQQDQVDLDRIISMSREPVPLFSADSHVVEDPTLWSGIMPDGYFGPHSFHDRPGRVDPVARLDEMAADGVDGEVLYPSLGLGLFGLDDAGLQQRAFERYNSWLIEFCQVNPKVLIGIGLISVYDMDHAVAELERCARGGLRGCELWQSPHPALPFTGRHYEPLWEAAASLEMPVSLHILTGFNYSRKEDRIEPLPDDPITRGIEGYKGSVTRKLLAVSDALLEIMFSGTLERHPKLKLVLVENEIGWIPFVLDQFDYYSERHRKIRPTGMSRPPSEYFGSQVFSTFFRDPVGMKMLGSWKGADGCMWSSDYPHPNSTWPNSQRIVSENLGYLDEPTRLKIIRDTAMKLYSLAETR